MSGGGGPLAPPAEGRFRTVGRTIKGVWQRGVAVLTARR